MVTLYTSPSCTSCRKARAWLKEHNIPYAERNIFSDPLSVDELKQILQMTEDGKKKLFRHVQRFIMICMSISMICL